MFFRFAYSSGESKGEGKETAKCGDRKWRIKSDLAMITLTARPFSLDKKNIEVYRGLKIDTRGFAFNPNALFYN